MNIKQEINIRLLACTLWSLLEDRLQYDQLHVHQPTAAYLLFKSMNDYTYRSSSSYLAELIQNHGSLSPGNSNIHYHLEDYTDSHIAIRKVERAFIRLMTTSARVRDAPDNR